MKVITEEQFIVKAQQENCRANLEERKHAVSPSYVKYSCNAQDFLKEKTYPTWRTNRSATKVIGAYETPKNDALPISYVELSRKPHLFSEVNFNREKDYLKTTCIIAFHCETCGVYVVKDGNHRLLQCAVHSLNPDLDVYLVVSRDWSLCKVDMKNFCECISNNAL